MGKYSAPVEDHLIVPAEVGLTPGSEVSQRMVGDPVPAPVRVRLLIDTGSKRTTLIPGIIRHLNPPRGDDVRLVSALAVGMVTLFWVRLAFPGTGLALFENVQVARLAMPPDLARFHGVLGRDLLRRFESFDYEGTRGRYTLRDMPGLFGWLRRCL
jgi:hypothetical protein